MIVKYYLKDKNQEVKVGDRVTISVPASTPYGQAKCEVSVLVTQESLKQLIKDGLVVIKEENAVNFEDYKPFIRRLARKCNITFPEAVELLDSIKSVSIYAHNILLKEMMAEVFNRGKEHRPLEYYVNYNAISCDGNNLPMPSFVDKEDAEKAHRLMKPFYEEARKRKGKQED